MSERHQVQCDRCKEWFDLTSWNAALRVGDRPAGWVRVEISGGKHGGPQFYGFHDVICLSVWAQHQERARD